MKNTRGAYAKNHKPSVAEYVDYDYLNKLSESEKEWLAQFSDEYYGARFNREKSIHSNEKRKDLYNDNNRRNRDIMCVKAKSRGEFNKE